MNIVNRLLSTYERTKDEVKNESTAATLAVGAMIIGELNKIGLSEGETPGALEMIAIQLKENLPALGEISSSLAQIADTLENIKDALKEKDFE